jgi:hypothetical protein
VENGEWKMENGKWKVENGKWRSAIIDISLTGALKFLIITAFSIHD